MATASVEVHLVSSISYLLMTVSSFSMPLNMRAKECILGEYERLSGQAINFQNFGIFFSSNASDSLRSNISIKLRVSTPLNTRKYLGLPSIIRRDKRASFAYLRERLWNRLQGWQSKLLFQAGKEVKVKMVAQAIPTYYMSSFLLLVSLCQELEHMMNSFWWGMKPEGGRRINWIK